MAFQEEFSRGRVKRSIRRVVPDEDAGHIGRPISLITRSFAMTTRHLGFLAIAAAMTFGLLAPRAARAAGEEFVGDWQGTYYSNGEEVRGSHLTLFMDPLLGLDGNWDGFPVIGVSYEGNQVHLALSATPKGGTPPPGIDHYLATCEVMPDGLKIVYVGRSPSGEVLRSGGTRPGVGFRK
jgi:hypothetical protein